MVFIPNALVVAIRCFGQLSVTVTKILTKTKSKKGYFGLWFHKFQSKVNWLHCYRPVVRQSILEVKWSSVHFLEIIK